MWVSMISLELNAQFAQDSFDAIERDSEITRVTLKNHLENWNKAPLLNSVRKTKVNYTKGQGLSITIDAPNSRVFLENGVKWSFKEDKALLDTFYDENIIKLQQERMVECLTQFVADFHSYFPKIANNESYVIEVEVDDEPNKSGEKVNSEKIHLRQYRMKLSIEAQDFSKLESDNKRIKELTTVEIEQL